MDWMSLIAQVGGSAVGQPASQMDRDQAMKLIQAAVDDMGQINVPRLQQLFLQQQGKSELGSIKDDPGYRDQQNAADAQLNDVINSGGLTLADKAALNAIRNKTARTESAGRNAIANDMAARGTLDSGAQLAMQLQGNQQSANSLAAADESAAAQGQARSFAAIKERAAMATAGLNRTYAMQADAARANDAINAGNTAIANTAAKYNAAIPQQDFNNKMSLAQAKAQPGYVLAGAKAASAKDTQQAWQGAGNATAAALKDSGGSGNGNTGGNDPGLDSSGQSDLAGNRGGAGDLSGGSTDDALTGAQTRPGTDGREIIGYRPDGTPIYGQPQGSNY